MFHQKQFVVQVVILIGLLYKQEKKVSGGDHKSGQFKENQSCHNDNLEKTEEVIAKQHDISPRTVRRAGDYSEAMDTISKTRATPKGPPQNDAALSFIINNQLGRRNLTKVAKMHLIGLLYKQEKKGQGGDHGNQHTKVASCHNDNLPKTKKECIIVDGHNRYEICNEHNIPFKVAELELSDRDAVINFIINNQLGRRNLPKVAKMHLIGLLYKQEKKVQGGTGANQHKKKQSGQNDHSAKTEEVIAKQHNVSPKTVRRAVVVSEAVDGISKNAELPPRGPLKMSLKRRGESSHLRRENF